VFQQRAKKLTLFKRRQFLLELLRNQPGLRVPELARSVAVSEGTIRNDLNALEVLGRLNRVHGGAVLKEQEQFPAGSFYNRYQTNAWAKIAITRKAAERVLDGDSILLDASSTAYYLAKAIVGKQKLRVITNGFEVARELAQNLSNTVILIGGVVNHERLSVTGLLSEQIMTELHVDKAFVSCSGFSLDRGMTEVNLSDGQLKRKALESVYQVIALIDSSKFGKEGLTPFARPSQITHLITDARLTSEWIEKLTQAGIGFTICEGEAVPTK
jgi:DeoR/GlpR family transcriptional regulator of sugar metabolism